MNTPHDDTIALDGASLSIEQVLAVAYGQPGVPRVVLSPTASVQVARAAQAVQRLLAQGTVAYGITTGFGAFKDRMIPPDQIELLQRNILCSHAVGVGVPFDTPTTARTACRLERRYSKRPSSCNTTGTGARAPLQGRQSTATGSGRQTIGAQ